MDTKGRLVVSSRNKNEYVLISAEENERETCEFDDLEHGFNYLEHHGDYDGDGDELDGPDFPTMDKGSQPLCRKLPIPSSKINPYRIVVLLRIVILVLFLNYRIRHPVHGANTLWLTSIICEVWLAITWTFDQCTKLSPINRKTYIDRLSLRYEKEGKPSELPPVDVFVTTVDTNREPPLLTANTVLSILAIDYPIGKVACYVSDDGSSLLSYEALCETSEFARKWVPYCKKFSIEPRAPEWHFSEEVGYLEDKVESTFVREHRAMKNEYNEFKIRIDSLVATAKNAHEDSQTMQDGSPWPGNNVKDHPGMIQVFLGQSSVRDIEGNELPRLIYISREKRPGFDHHKKAGSLNSMLRLSAITSNAPYVLNLDCDHYINDSKALKDAMCFMMDPQAGKQVGYVQYPQRYYGIDPHDRYSNRNYVFFDINMKGLDGIQGPLYIGTGCVFRRQAFYGYDSPQNARSPGEKCHCLPKWHICCFGSRKSKKEGKTENTSKNKTMKNLASTQTHVKSIELAVEGIKREKISLIMPKTKLETRFGRSPVFIASTLLREGGVPPGATSASLLKEAIHVISCDYENETQWGKEVGWIYGSVSEDILTGFKMHSDGWQSVYSIPKRPAFLGSAPINLSDRLHQACRWALGSVEIMLSRYCPIWFAHGRGLKTLERFAYLNCIIYPLNSLPLIVYCTLPAIGLLTGASIFSESSTYASFLIGGMFLSIFMTCILEGQWGDVGIWDWWRNEQFWVIGGLSAHFLALIQGTLKVCFGVNITFIVTPKAAGDGEFSDLYIIKWTPLLVPPMAVMIINIVGVIVGFSDAISTNNGYESCATLFGRLFFSFWVIVHLYPFLQGFMGKHERLVTILIVCSVLLVCAFSFLWLRNPFYPTYNAMYP